MIPWNLLKRHSTDKYTKLTTGKALLELHCASSDLALSWPRPGLGRRSPNVRNLERDNVSARGRVAVCARAAWIP